MQMWITHHYIRLRPKSLSFDVCISCNGAGRLVLVGEDVDRTLSKNQHILNIVPTSAQHTLHPNILSTRNPTT